MPGTLHIFRLNPDPPEYQVNYNIGSATWVRVFTPVRLDDFLRHSTGLPLDTVDDLSAELRDTGHITAQDLELPESHLAEMGFAESPSDD